MIADLGLSKQLNVDSTSNSAVFGMSAYIEPQCYKNDNYVRDKKSDIYSLGVLLWEITSGYPPFLNIPNHILSVKIVNGFREEPITNTPLAYESLYEKCWDDDPNLRPTIDEVFDILKEISLQFNNNNENNSTIMENSNRLEIENEINSNLINDSLIQSIELSLEQIENQISSK
jgi:hypothetical protein